MGILRPFVMGLAVAGGASFVLKHAMSSDTEYLTAQLTALIPNNAPIISHQRSITDRDLNKVRDAEREVALEFAQVGKFVHNEWQKFKYEMWNPALRSLGRKLMPPPE